MNRVLYTPVDIRLYMPVNATLYLLLLARYNAIWPFRADDAPSKSITYLAGGWLNPSSRESKFFPIFLGCYRSRLGSEEGKSGCD